MKTKIVEVTNGVANWGKFLVGQFDEEEWKRRSVIPENDTVRFFASSSQMPLLRQVGWSQDVPYLMVLDLQTAEGAVFRIGGLARADLNKHRVWVCPMFEPFLEWLYKNWEQGYDLAKLPDHVDLPNAPFAMHGYRRSGE